MVEVCMRRDYVRWPDCSRLLPPDASIRNWFSGQLQRAFDGLWWDIPDKANPEERTVQFTLVKGGVTTCHLFWTATAMLPHHPNLPNLPDHRFRDPHPLLVWTKKWSASTCWAGYGCKGCWLGLVSTRSGWNSSPLWGCNELVS
jgi:hypothetical protein